MRRLLVRGRTFFVPIHLHQDKARWFIALLHHVKSRDARFLEAVPRIFNRGLTKRLNCLGLHADVDMNGKRLRAARADLRVIGGPAKATVRVNIDLQPRSGSLSELNVIGCTVDEALTRAGRFLDETMFTDQRSVRVVHGYGTGQLRRAIAGFLKHHPLVASFEEAPPGQGGGGVTVVELKD